MQTAPPTARTSGRKTEIRVALLAVATVAIVSFGAHRAEAHAVGISTGEYRAEGKTVHVKLTFARGEVAQWLPALDANRDGHVTAIEVQEAKAALQDAVLGRIHVSVEKEACPPAILTVGLTEQDGLLVEGLYNCDKSGPIEVDVALLEVLAPGHRHAARVIDSTARDELLSRDRTRFEMLSVFESAAAPNVPEASKPVNGLGFFKVGVEHILTGYDHLVFIFGLLLVRATLKQLVAVLTAFTVAHSTSLALVLFGVLSPSARTVEPAIALSIAYIGIENLFVKDGRRRWRITFPFGLLHGFGFAGAVREVGLRQASIPTALLAFNLGVEAGQLAVLAIVLPAIVWLRNTQLWFDPKGARVLSGAVALAGGIWFVVRVLGG